jgi:alkanesulfonate monooxygenase SsuD/methylene tetrahydromethanopterin reductase-like flavin-dependent oxidoreductase (luciferase family)
MRLGLFFEGFGHHIAAWRDPKVDATARQEFEHFADMAQTAERACFDLLFTADTFAMFGPNDPDSWSRTTRMSRHEPLTLLSGLAAVTKNIGLVATASTTFYEPFHIARFLASLDQISGGRASGRCCHLRPVVHILAHRVGALRRPDRTTSRNSSLQTL